jgi:hypothetical protein
MRLRELKVRNALIGNIGCLALSAVMRLLPSVEILDLAGNGIECSGIHALCQCLVSHPSISSVDVSDNLIATSGLSDLYFLALENGRIRAICVDRNASESAVWGARLAKVLSRNAVERAEVVALDHGRKYAVCSLVVTLSDSCNCIVSATISSDRGDAELSSEPFDRAEELIAKAAAERFVSSFIPCNMLSISRIDGSTIKVVVDSFVSDEWFMNQPELQILKNLPDPGLTTTTILIVNALARNNGPFGELLRALAEERYCLETRVKMSNHSTLAHAEFFNRSRFVEASCSLVLEGSAVPCRCVASSLAQVYKEQLDECRGALSKELETLLHRLHDVNFCTEGSPHIDRQLENQAAAESAEAQAEALKTQKDAVGIWTS